jgi:hypothetical protein
MVTSSIPRGHLRVRGLCVSRAPTKLLSSGWSRVCRSPFPVAFRLTLLAKARFPLQRIGAFVCVSRVCQN